MRFVHKFNNFINEEWSKNDPIPELTREEKLGIVLLGTPGIGKSTFIKEYIHPRNFNLKVFSTDDVSLTFTKDPNVYHQTASDLNLNRLLQFLDTDQGFIYDTTGTQEQNILKVYNSAKSKGYKVIFIHLMGSLEQALSGNVQRTRKVPEDYLKASYDKQQKSIELYSSLNPDGYYIVERVDSGYNISNLENKDKLIRTFEAYVETPKFFRFSKSKMIDVDDTEITPTVKRALWGSERFNEILIGFGFPDQMKCIHFLDELAFDLFLKNLYGEHIYQIIIDDESDLGWSFFIPINDWYYKSNSYYYELKRNVEFQELHKGEFGQFNSHNEPIDDEDVKATQILIDKGFIGKGKLKDLMSSRFFGKAKVFVSTTDKVKVRNYQQAEKPPKDPKPYVNKPVLTKDDFISSGISPEKIADFWKSDFGRKVQRMKDTADFYLRREEALNQLNKWIKTST